MAFVHLHTHSEFSALDGMVRLSSAFTKTAEAGQNALAITDHGTLGGIWKARRFARENNVKLIPGVEVYVAIGSRFEKNSLIVPVETPLQGDGCSHADDDCSHGENDLELDGADPDSGDVEDGVRKKHYWHLTLLATSEQGWKNLIAIQNAAFETIHHKPRIDFDLLAEYGEGIIALTGCLGGIVAEPLSRAHETGLRLPALRERFTAMLERHAAMPDTPAEAKETHADALAKVKAALDDAEARFVEAPQQARANLDALVQAIGHANVYVEIMEHGIASEQAIIADIVALATEYELPLVATNDSHYLEEKDHLAHEAWLAMQSKKTLADEKRYRFTGHGFFLRNEEQMRALRTESWWQDAVSNTQLVADRVQDDIIPDPSPRMPRYPVPEGQSARQILIDKIFAGASQRFGENWREERHDVRERLNHEFQVIDSMGFGDYFLIVEDVITWARTQNILVGPGRGSAAGSLVSYVLGIVNVDPLRYGLLFERFLEAGRPDWPDIDMDFEKSRLDDVLTYMMRKWGVRSVARIGSFAVSKSRASIKSSARVQSIGFGAGDKLSKLVPVSYGQPWPLEQLLDESNAEANDFRVQLAKLGTDGDRIIELASEFEGLVTGVGIHACGVVVANIDLDDVIPLRQDTSKVAGEQLTAVTAWDSKDIEAAGFLKLDFLSLRTLDVIARTVQYIEATTGEVIDPDNPPDPDDLSNPRVAAAYHLLREGRTAGVFQAESGGMSKVFQNVQASSLEDISAVVALFRPGPLSAGMDVRYADRKHGREQVTYDYITRDLDEQAVIREVLDVTYGTTVYQEQVMLLSRKVAGFSVSLANKLRKAMGKKDHEIMDELEVLFVDGSQSATAYVEGASEPVLGGEPKQVFSEATARRLWDLLKGNADYLFNKSHSVAYAYIAYTTAYLKATWPAEFCAAILATTDAGEKRLSAIRSLTAEGIEILAPSVNKSRGYTFPEGSSAVRLGLTEIKGLGVAGDSVYAGRGEHDNDPYTDLYDLAIRVRDESGKALQTNHLEALIESGACDEFGTRMGQYMVARAVRSYKEAYPRIDMEWGPIERATRQRGRLLTSLGEHPLTTVQDFIRTWRTPDSEVYDQVVYGQSPVPIASVLNKSRDGDSALTLGILGSWRERTYSGGRMANINIEGSMHSLDCVIWDGSMGEIKASFGDAAPVPGTIVAISGRVVLNIIEHEDDEGNVVDISKKEMMVTKMYPVDVPDAPRGQLAASALTVPKFVPALTLVDVEPDPVEPSEEEPDPVSETATVTETELPVIHEIIREAEKTNIFGFSPHVYGVKPGTPIHRLRQLMPSNVVTAIGRVNRKEYRYKPTVPALYPIREHGEIIAYVVVCDEWEEWDGGLNIPSNLPER